MKKIIEFIKGIDFFWLLMIYSFASFYPSNLIKAIVYLVIISIAVIYATIKVIEAIKNIKL